MILAKILILGLTKLLIMRKALAIEALSPVLHTEYPDGTKLNLFIIFILWFLFIKLFFSLLFLYNKCVIIEFIIGSDIMVQKDEKEKIDVEKYWNKKNFIPKW